MDTSFLSGMFFVDLEVILAVSLFLAWQLLIRKSVDIVHEDALHGKVKLKIDEYRRNGYRLVEITSVSSSQERLLFERTTIRFGRKGIGL